MAMIFSLHSSFLFWMIASWSTNCCFPIFPPTNFSARIAWLFWYSRRVLNKWKIWRIRMLKAWVYSLFANQFGVGMTIFLMPRSFWGSFQIAKNVHSSTEIGCKFRKCGVVDLSIKRCPYPLLLLNFTQFTQRTFWHWLQKLTTKWIYDSVSVKFVYWAIYTCKA